MLTLSVPDRRHPAWDRSPWPAPGWPGHVPGRIDPRTREGGRMTAAELERLAREQRHGCWRSRGGAPAPTTTPRTRCNRRS